MLSNELLNNLAELKIAAANLDREGLLTAGNAYFSILFPSSEINNHILNILPLDEQYRSKLQEFLQTNGQNLSFTCNLFVNQKDCTIQGKIQKDNINGWTILMFDRKDFGISDPAADRNTVLTQSGILARRISHDFANNLTSVMGYSELALAKLNSDDKFYNYFNTIRESSKLILNELNALKRIYAQTLPDPAPQSINELISSAIPRFREKWGPGFDISFTPEGTDNSRVNIDRKSLLDAVEAVLQNSFEAADKNSQVNIRSYCKSGDCISTENPEKTWLCLEIADNGPGMGENELKQALTPFYSTKKDSVANGIGLTLADQSIIAAGGHLQVKSSIGAGTVIQIFLPCV